jgi:hypothetical protein
MRYQGNVREEIQTAKMSVKFLLEYNQLFDSDLKRKTLKTEPTFYTPYNIFFSSRESKQTGSLGVQRGK